MQRTLASAALAALLSSCATPPPSPSAPEPIAGVSIPEPGRPFGADQLLTAMRGSRRPDGVPDELEADAVAGALGDAIWTLDGLPWQTISSGGSCGPQTCTLEIAGAAAEAQGEDLWVFEVAPDSGAVELVSADLRSLPLDLVGRLDELTRSLHPSLDELNLTSVRWLPPPDVSQFVVSYRSGDEEGSSCGADITVDAVAPAVVSDLVPDC